MARVRPIEDTEASREAQAVFRGAARLLGWTSNFMRTIARAPGVARWMMPYIAAVQREGVGTRLDGRIKELAILKTSLVNACHF